MRNESALTQEMLKTVLDYNPETGEFIWLERPLSAFVDQRARNCWNAHYAGNVAGCTTAYGYRVITINFTYYMAHRLAFLYMTGKFPEDKTDHINGVRADNRWINLRAVSHRENMINAKLTARNKSGQMGVRLHKKSGKWYAKIKVDCKEVWLGSFSDKADAIAARKEAEITYGYHANHGRA